MRHKALYTVLAGIAATSLAASTATAAGTVMYDAVPDPLPSQTFSFGYETTETREFGQAIYPETTGPLDSVTLTMSSSACVSGSWDADECETPRNDDGSLPTFDHLVTINLYTLDTPDADSPLEDPFATVTQMIAVPYRPSNDTEFCGPGEYLADDYPDSSGCAHEYAFNATFDFSEEDVTLPSEFVVGVAYNTQSYGAEPTGLDGPYNSLNVGLHERIYSEAPYVGESGDIYWDFTWYSEEDAGFTAVGFEWDIMIRFETAPSVPVTADDCKKGGFEQYGFTNQGQCVASVKANENAGKS